MIRKRFSIILLALFLLTACIGCGDQDITNQQPTTAGSQNQAEQGTDTIQIDSYNSDQMKKLGYKLELQGTRFPLPTTLNELGKDWSFNLGDTSDRESGAYNGQRYWRVGNVYTAEWYEAYTDNKLHDTAIELCYKNIPVLLAGIDGFKPDGSYGRDLKIIGITDSIYGREKGFWGISINGVVIGDLLDLSLENAVGAGKWINAEHYKAFIVENEGLSIIFSCTQKKKKLQISRYAHLD